jgi:hypothetical protein
MGTVATAGQAIAIGGVPDAESIATNFVLAGGFEVLGEATSVASRRLQSVGKSPQSIKPEAPIPPPTGGVAPTTTAASDPVPPETRTLWRGVKRTSPAYDQATKGVAKPRGGHSDPYEHNAIGDTESIFTSWTTQKMMARVHAQEGGVLLQAEIPEPRCVASPDVFNEGEVLVTGEVSGARVIHQ